MKRKDLIREMTREADAHAAAAFQKKTTMTISMYSKEALGQARSEGYEEGYQAGHLDAHIQALRQARADLVRLGIIETLKADYEQKLIQAKKAYEEAYQAGRADGYQEGAAAGRLERIAAILAQVKEGGPVAVAIAERIEAEI